MWSDAWLDRSIIQRVLNIFLQWQTRNTTHQLVVHGDTESVSLVDQNGGAGVLAIRNNSA